MGDFFIDASELPEGFAYPDSFLKLVRLDLVELEPWFILNRHDAQYRMQGLGVRYPGRVLIPFARRFDNDDVACFAVNRSDEVQIIHDYASSGYEQRKTYACFWDWFREAIEEMIIFD
jgi:hypothetical protein